LTDDLMRAFELAQVKHAFDSEMNAAPSAEAVDSL
jgi:hypothetical protein